MITSIIYTFIASFLGLIIRLSLSFSRQRWASTFHFTLTALLIPPITFIITKVISGNIALSLGMVGALSIVRFRNPVKSSFELTIFFCLITIGITMSVSPKVAIFLAVFTSLTTLIMSKIVEKKIFKQLFYFNFSFEEGDSGTLLEVKSKDKIEEIEECTELNSKAFDKISNEVYYSLIFQDKTKFQNLLDKIDNNSKLINYEFKNL
jgi:hypothetical protein